MSDIWKAAACVNVVSLSTPVPRPTWKGGVPACGIEKCPHYRSEACVLSDSFDRAVCIPVATELARMIGSMGVLLTAAEEARDAARADARVLAHAYTHDSRPPADVVERALAYPEKEET